MIRDYRETDRPAVDQVVREAWSELASVMPGWDELASRFGTLTSNADRSEVLVAELDGEILGTTAYVGPHQAKPEFFAPEWPMVRFMSVLPKARGQGVGRALLDECIRRAKRDDTGLIALHTTPVMEAAEHLYRHAGFQVVRHLPNMYGVPFVLMTRVLQARANERPAAWTGAAAPVHDAGPGELLTRPP
jgi:GNAT superfamily N-acetyltransferase